MSVYFLDDGDTDYKLALRVDVSMKHFNNKGLPWEQGGESGTLLGKMLGFRDYKHMQETHYLQKDNGPVSRQLELLLGPHGDAIWVAMKIKRGLG